MNKLIMVSVVFVLSMSSFATHAHAEGDDVLTVSCSLNRSISLVTEIENNGEATSKVTLTQKHFLWDDKKVVVLDRAQVIQYGNVIMISQNNGRSGYAFLRFETSADGQVDGWIDINLFMSSIATNTHGKLLKHPCSMVTR